MQEPKKTRIGKLCVMCCLIPIAKKGGRAAQCFPVRVFLASALFSYSDQNITETYVLSSLKIIICNWNLTYKNRNMGWRLRNFLFEISSLKMIFLSGRGNFVFFWKFLICCCPAVKNFDIWSFYQMHFKNRFFCSVLNLRTEHLSCSKVENWSEPNRKRTGETRKGKHWSWLSTGVLVAQNFSGPFHIWSLAILITMYSIKKIKISKLAEILYLRKQTLILYLWIVINKNNYNGIKIITIITKTN
jgi:hypothetical protein